MALWHPGRHSCYNGNYKGLPSRKMELIPKKLPQFRLRSETRPHEVGIASNRGSAIPRWICSRALYSPPVNSRELVTAEDSAKGLGWDQWQGISRNKVPLPEGGGETFLLGIFVLSDSSNETFPRLTWDIYISDLKTITIWSNWKISKQRWIY